ncbi:hypothetical protein BU16DRAFT_616223 [Lophium mytilinum]|uniref:BTB domain-containing protein n=1 Tax=Lophium mytilinum TaxID=390894 RepID=A0A6A6QZA1_9PEZI|nr:hypothetical protein BU16DRAFT_616223 [Lophium mytilinum]
MESSSPTPSGPSTESDARTMSDNPSSPRLHRTVSLDDSSDIALVIGEECSDEPVRVEVLKGALRLSSSVWKTMFEPGRWVESSKAEVAFPDDDPEAMLMILRIVHLRFRELPEGKLSLAKLLSLAVVCDKYATVGIVRPWLHVWVDIPKKVTSEPDWLFVAWVFGYTRIFQDVANKLVTYLDTDSDTYNSLMLDPKPPGIVENILQARIQVIQRILDICYTTLDKSAGARHKCCQHSSPLCSAAIVGAVVQGYYNFGLLPHRLNANTTTMSIYDLTAKLKNFDLLTHKELEYGGYLSHLQCPASYINILYTAQEIGKKAPKVVEDKHLRHMEAQTKA